MNPPKIPNWRYLYKYGNGDVPNEVLAYKAFIAETKRNLAFKDLMEEAEEIYRTPPMREIVEEMLIERCPTKIIVKVVNQKFGLEYTNEVILNYTHWFFDTKTCSNYDIAKWRQECNQKQFLTPPVPNDMRPMYMEHVHGEIPDIDPETALRVLANQTFFRAAELAKYGWDADKKFLEFAKTSADMMRELRSKADEAAKSKEQEFNYVVEYPESTAINADELEGYDMEDLDDEQE